MSNWQPIETAPRDGKDFVGLGRNWGDPDGEYHAHVVHFTENESTEGDWYGRGADGIRVRFAYLTHWMPLPPLPTP